MAKGLKAFIMVPLRMSSMQNVFNKKSLYFDGTQLSFLSPFERAFLVSLGHKAI